MTDCRDIEALLAEHATGDLALDDEARLQAHLDGCARCRREIAAYGEALDLSRVPVDGRYRDALAGLDASTLAAWKGRRRRRAAVLALAGGLAAVAAAALLALSPSLVDRGEPPAQAQGARASAWEPDVDSAIAAAAVLDADVYGESTSYGSYADSASYGSSESSAEDVVLAAFDAAEQ